MPNDIISPEAPQPEIQGNDSGQPEIQEEEQKSGNTVTGLSSILSQFVQGQKDENSNDRKVENADEVKNDKPVEGEPNNQQPEPPAEPKSPEGGEPNPPFKKWEDMNQSELIDKAKSFQSRYDKTKADYDKVLTSLQEREQMLNTIFQNPVEAFKQIAPELADVLSIEEPVTATVLKWQENVLLPELQKRYPNVVDENWTPDSLEAMRPGTPSYEFQRATYAKQNELENRRAMAHQQRAQSEKMNEDMQRIAVENNAKDRNYLLNDFGLSQEQLEGYAKKYDEMVEKSANDPYPDWHPNRIRNIIKSVFFDEIMESKVQKAVAEAVGKVHNEYKMKGLSLPKNDVPVDITSVKSSDAQKVPTVVKGQQPRAIDKLFGQFKQ